MNFAKINKSQAQEAARVVGCLNVNGMPDNEYAPETRADT